MAELVDSYYRTPDGKVALLHGHVLDVLKAFPAESVNCVVTSPPYWSLRKYDGCDSKWGNWVGQYGHEKSLELYIEHTRMWLREIKRVLRKEGVCWLNLGDGYISGDADLMPFRVIVAAQTDGWRIRSTIIWHKSKTTPESVRNRPTKAHEYIFLLAKGRPYWYDADAIREPSVDQSSNNTRNCRSVWTVPAQNYAQAHFAVFSAEIPNRCIRAGCPEWVCPKCSKARVRIVERHNPIRSNETAIAKLEAQGVPRTTANIYGAHRAGTIETIGWTDCGCGEGFVGGVVLDPFAGSGVTCEVAHKLGRRAIGIDTSAKYLDLAIERLDKEAKVG